MSRVSTAGARWRSLYGRWYLRHSALTYLLVRVVLTLALAWAKQPVMGPDVGVGIVLIVPFVVWTDRLPRATRTLMSNLGFTRAELTLSTLLVAAACEPLMQLVAVPVLGAALAALFSIGDA